MTQLGNDPHSLPKKSEDILELIKSSPTEKIKVAVTDIDGVLRGKYLLKSKFLSALESGFGFCNVVFGWDSSDVCYDQEVEYTGWHTGYPDALARIDINSFRQIPWENNLAFFLADFESSNSKSLSICPRQLLKKIISQAHQMGFSPFFGLEFEWFNFQETPETLAAKKYQDPKPLTPGMYGYSLLRSSLNQPYFKALMDELHQFRVPLEGLHTETGPGVFEAALLYSDALEAGDRAVLFKNSTKEIAYRFGIMPSFIAKWNVNLPGCSGHHHQSLWNLTEDKNLFYSSQDPHGMSDTFKHYLAGQMKCLSEILPLFAPTVNSYKRLVDGYWAPTKVSWGIDNRTTAFRVIPGSSKSTRLETRVPGSDINPYLAIAACLASGLYGIKNKLPLNEAPITGSAYLSSHAKSLPKNLYDATQKMADSPVAHELFGKEFVDHFTKTRFWEWRQFQTAVTDWEMKRYFEII
ncbi:MAG: glutamine synthetase family protein [Bdellovibrionales bacterium]|nr:glutamine synthetase family protein [Bdellovibrionales bacterium]